MEVPSSEGEERTKVTKLQGGSPTTALAEGAVPGRCSRALLSASLECHQTGVLDDRPHSAQPHPPTLIAQRFTQLGKYPVWLCLASGTGHQSTSP